MSGIKGSGRGEPPVWNNVPSSSTGEASGSRAGGGDPGRPFRGIQRGAWPDERFQGIQPRTAHAPTAVHAQTAGGSGVSSLKARDWAVHVVQNGMSVEQVAANLQQRAPKFQSTVLRGLDELGWNQTEQLATAIGRPRLRGPSLETLGPVPSYPGPHAGTVSVQQPNLVPTQRSHFVFSQPQFVPGPGMSPGGIHHSRGGALPIYQQSMGFAQPQQVSTAMPSNRHAQRNPFVLPQAIPGTTQPFGHQFYATSALQRLGENGVCATLTAKVLKESFVSDMRRPPQFLQEGHQLEREHNLYEARRANRATTFHTDEEDLLHPLGLETAEEESFVNENTEATWRAILNDAIATPGRYYITLGGGNLDGHAIGLVTGVQGGQWIFDANHGLHATNDANGFVNGNAASLYRNYGRYPNIDVYRLQTR